MPECRSSQHSGLRGAAALLCVTLMACSSSERAPAAGGPPAEQRGQTVVARIDGQEITMADFERRLREQPPYVRARYASPERRKELLENLVRFEILAREARKRGYERDPDVVRTAKQRVVQTMIAEEIDPRLDRASVTDEELDRHYRQHPEAFSQGEAVRVSQIVVEERALADKVAAQARALSRGDDGAFGRLVALHSVDEDSKQRGGDLTFLERGSSSLPAAVLEAAFALREPGDVSPPVQGDRGFHILRLTQRRAAGRRPLEEVKAEVRNHLMQQRRGELVDQWVAEMRKNVKVEVFEDKLQALATSPNQKP